MAKVTHPGRPKDEEPHVKCTTKNKKEVMMMMMIVVMMVMMNMIIEVIKCTLHNQEQ